MAGQCAMSLAVRLPDGKGRARSRPRRTLNCKKTVTNQRAACRHKPGEQAVAGRRRHRCPSTRDLSGKSRRGFGRVESVIVGGFCENGGTYRLPAPVAHPSTIRIREIRAAGRKGCRSEFYTGFSFPLTKCCENDA
jgi:hypothetical protein